jgi:hypothetical protein
LGDFRSELAHFSTNFIHTSAYLIAPKISAKQTFNAYTIMHNMLQILIDKKSFLRIYCKSSSPNKFTVILVIVHKPIFDSLSCGCSN